MNGLGLSPEAIEMRRRYVQAGDAARIMSGEWRAVWREKMGLDAGPDLDDVLAVQLGSFTEPLNLAWAMKTTGRPITYYSDNLLMGEIWLHLMDEHPEQPELQVSEAYPWMAANLDGITTTPAGERCVIDAKHLGQAYEQEILRYTAAMTHQATVMGTDWWALSCLIGNRKHEVIYQEVDPIYQAQLISATREFWSFVESGIEPDDRTEPKPPPKPQPKLRQIILDTLPSDEQPNWSSEFARLARTFAETDGAFKLHQITREEIKALVPEDVGLVQLGLVKYRRDGRGQTIALDKPKEEK